MSVERTVSRSPNARWGIALAMVTGIYLTLMFVGTHVREEALPFSLRWEIALHASAYAGLSCLLLLGSLWRVPGLGLAKRVLLVFGLSVLCAIADECTQPLTGRSLQAKDLAADLAGITATLALFALFLRWHQRRQQRSF